MEAIIGCEQQKQDNKIQKLHSIPSHEQLGRPTLTKLTTTSDPVSYRLHLALRGSLRLSVSAASPRPCTAKPFMCHGISTIPMLVLVEVVHA